MESKVNYAVVGLFVILFGMLGAVIVVWLIGSGSMRSNYKNYIVYTSENISGLHTDSTVRYKGLDIGKVSKIVIDKKHPNFIKIYIEVSKNIPIKKNTIATISSSGLTGISYINLSYSKYPYKPLFKIKAKYPVIYTKPNQLEKVLNKLPKIINSINNAFNKINAAFNQHTINSIQETTSNINKLTKELRKTNLKAQKLLKDSDKLIYSLQKDLNNIDAVTNLVKKTVIDIDNLTKNLNSTTSYTKETLIKEGISTLKETKRTLLELKQLIIEIRRNPSIIIKGKKEFNPIKDEKK